MKLTEANTSSSTYRSHYEERIEQLRVLGSEENISIRPESERDFWKFISSIRNLKKCSLMLLDGGSISAFWSKRAKYSASLGFFGGDKVQFTFITYGQDDNNLFVPDRMKSGKCSVKELAPRIEEFRVLFE